MIYNEQKFDYIKIKLASPNRIKEWGQRVLPNGQIVGEVTKSETINYRTFKPEMDGLFCERIFGPNKNLECHCGKYKRVRYEGLICDRCGVEITESRVRRHRMGYIDLIYPVTHIWYLKSRPNYMALLLEIEQPQFYILNHQNDKWLSKTILEADKRVKVLKLANIAYFIAEDEHDFYQKHLDFKQYRYGRRMTPNKLLLTGKPPEKFTIQKNFIGAATIKYELELLDLRLELEKTRKFLTKLIFSMDYEISLFNIPIQTNDDLHKTATVFKQLQYEDFIEKEKKTKELINPTLEKKSKKKDGSPLNDSKNSGQSLNNNQLLLLFQRRTLWIFRRKVKLLEKTVKRIRILENLIATESSPAWMIISILPVIPPGLRPMIQLEGGRFATSDLNELYRRVITRNNRLTRLLEIDAPQLIIRNEKRMLQEAVDALIDNGKRGKTAFGANNRPLKSLSDIIKGKQGRFRLNLLGKRVDYSGRSVIIVGPGLKLNQCGLPFEIAIELFQPFIIRELINQGLASNIKVAKNFIQKNEAIIEPVLNEVLLNHPVFLNRAPTLHRLGIQAFEPILVPGRAIHLHPLVCSAFNADFDGDQMAVHVPLSLEAQAESYILMLAPYNFLSPATGEPIIMPSQDMVLGCYYLTVNNIAGLLSSNHYFANFDDVLLAYNQDKIELHSVIWVRYLEKIELLQPLIKTIQLNDGSRIEYYNQLQIRKNQANEIIAQYIQTTTGRVIFNTTVQKVLNMF
uniref:RNA polymerase b' subunit n=1 Tax=Tenuicylindrus belgicus TaxID=1398096 RepID=UPI002238143C|nr:RNA polymerase b' subunit [Tenuicylindrus belgicus]UYC31606.1 RNA polymerase b' subunit [Tenuicylindrus belgicus]